MASTTYTYSIASDTANAAISARKLDTEVRADTSITIVLDGIAVTGDTLDITFLDAISAGEKTTLDGIVSAHDGVAPVKVVTMEVHLDGPEEDDGKPVVVMSPGPKSWRTFFTARGDDPSPTPPASGRGAGTEIGLDIGTGDPFPGDYNVEWSYNEPTYVHDGQLCWRDPAHFSRKDHFSLSVKGAATAVVANGSTEGNCNLVDAGGYNVIVPAAGDGTHDVDLGAATPVPAGLASNGYWDVDKSTDTLTVSNTPGEAKFHLLDVAFQSYFLRCISMIHWMGTFDIDTYMAEWVSPRWTWRLDVHKEAAPGADAEVAGWLYIFREKTN